MVPVYLLVSLISDVEAVALTASTSGGSSERCGCAAVKVEPRDLSVSWEGLC